VRSWPPTKLTRSPTPPARATRRRFKKLLDEGVDVNTKFRYDRTALSFAADRGHVDVVKVLLERGADVTMKDTFYNATALTWAVSPAMDRKPQHTDVVRLLLEHGGFSAEALKAALRRRRGRS
jgi:ankyrin repeat protein